LDVFVFPLQWLLWLGGLIVVAGGVVALGRKVRRQPIRPEKLETEVAHV
jgi:cytochrome c-type biogenesis protein CcmH/NrfF